MFFIFRAEHVEAVSEFKDGVAKFCGMEVHLILILIIGVY